MHLINKVDPNSPGPDLERKVDNALRGKGIPINVTEIEDVLEKRINGGIPITELFMVLNAGDRQGETFIETKWGKLRVYFRKYFPRNFILWEKKFRIPPDNATYESDKALNPGAMQNIHVQTN